MTSSRSAPVLILLLLPCLASAQTRYADPNSPAVQAAARAALSHARILDIVGVTSGIQGVTSGIQSVLQDLGARVTDQEVRIDLASDVLFDFDKFTLRPEASESLRKVGQVAAAYPKSPLAIDGHTDSKGLPPYNLILSANRAVSVRNWLVQNTGISASRISTRGLGGTKPIAANSKADGSDDPEGRQKNRRVEIVLRTQQ